MFQFFLVFFAPVNIAKIMQKKNKMFNKALRMLKDIPRLFRDVKVIWGDSWLVM